jgi:hypothetical protein
MRIEGNTIVFRSYRGNYENEKSGIKPCTCRLIPPNEWDAVCDFGYELAHQHRVGAKVQKIRIVCQENKSEYFERKLTFVEMFGDVLYTRMVLFCWSHEEGSVLGEN